MKIEIETRYQREITKVDVSDGMPTEMFYHDPLVALDCDFIAPNTKAIRINGEWFVPAEDSMSLRKEWEDAEHARDSSLDNMLKEFVDELLPK